jgi:hypothetical protein
MMNEKEMLVIALCGWITHIETGSFSGMDKNTILMLARDDKDMQRQARKLPIISVEQQEHITRIRNLITKVLDSKIKG